MGHLVVVLATRMVLLLTSGRSKIELRPHPAPPRPQPRARPPRGSSPPRHRSGPVLVLHPPIIQAPPCIFEVLNWSLACWSGPCPGCPSSWSPKRSTASRRHQASRPRPRPDRPRLAGLGAEMRSDREVPGMPPRTFSKPLRGDSLGLYPDPLSVAFFFPMKSGKSCPGSGPTLKSL